MRKIFNLSIILLVAFATLLPVAATAAEPTTYTIPVEPDDPDLEPENRKGQRIPSRPVMCIITPEGIQSSIDPADIVAYELWDESEVCLISTSDEMEFVTVLYTLRGNLALRIVTEGQIYIGFLSL